MGITDGRYVLLRAVADMTEPAYEYTLMPTHMKKMFSVEELKTAQMHPGFTFTKGVPVMKIEAAMNGRTTNNQQEGEDLLFDLQEDTKQMHPLSDERKKKELLEQMKLLMKENDAPGEAFIRYGI